MDDRANASVSGEADRVNEVIVAINALGSALGRCESNAFAIAALLAIGAAWAARNAPEFLDIARVGIEAVRKALPDATAVEVVESLINALTTPTPPDGHGLSPDSASLASNVISLLKRAA